MIDLSINDSNDTALCEWLDAYVGAMQSRTLEWAGVNTGSWNKDGLDKLAPMLAGAFSALDAEVECLKSPEFAPWPG